MWGFAGVASAKSEIKGAAILDNACGKVAVKQMGLVHAGNMDEANKLSTKEMQEQWKTMPAKDRTMMSGMMKEMSQTEAQYAADIKANNDPKDDLNAPWSAYGYTPDGFAKPELAAPGRYMIEADRFQVPNGTAIGWFPFGSVSRASGVPVTVTDGGVTTTDFQVLGFTGGASPRSIRGVPSFWIP